MVVPSWRYFAIVLLSTVPRVAQAGAGSCQQHYEDKEDQRKCSRNGFLLFLAGCGIMLVVVFLTCYGMRALCDYCGDRITDETSTESDSGIPRRGNPRIDWSCGSPTSQESSEVESEPIDEKANGEGTKRSSTVDGDVV